MPEVDITCLNSGSHPIRLIGSRGSGKTMILRSIAGKPLGQSIPDNSPQAVNRLRIYIRPDNQLMGAMCGWGIDQAIWKAASVELMLLRIFEEATNKVNFWLEKRDMPRLLIDADNFCFSHDGEDLANWIRVKQHALYKWARSPEGNPPIEVAALSSLAALIKAIELFVDEFPKKISVSVYFDEQETYLRYQQVIINDWIKNPPEGWVFHVAHRRYLDYVRDTSTDEVIDESNDFRKIDLDLPLVSSQTNSNRIREKFYTKIIQNEVSHWDSLGIDVQEFSPHQLLPNARSLLAENLRKNTPAKEAWRRLTEKAAKMVGCDHREAIKEGESLEDDRFWVLWPILIAREKDKSLDELNGTYIHNHFNGALLQIYFEAKGRAPMEYYSGFSALCSIVLSNVREFILILQQGIEFEHQEDGKRELVDILKNGISTTNQYRAVIMRSKHFNNVVAISAREHGHDIEKALSNWLTFFSCYQRLTTLPYNEPNHIICSDSIKKQTQAWQIIESGEKHGAFIFTLPSKQRENTKSNQIDIRIHPLLSATHYLSYAKRNTPSLTFDQIAMITTASDISDVKKIVEANQQKKKSNLYFQGTLFQDQE